MLGALTLAACSGAGLAQEHADYELYRLAPGYGWRDDHASSTGPVGTTPLLVQKGRWRFSARIESHEYDGLGDRTDDITSAHAFATKGYSFVPTSQTSQTTRFEVGYGVSDDLTLGIEVPYLDKQMDNVTSTGGTFRTESKGIGDVRLWAHNKWLRWGSEQAVWSVAFNIPTGSFDETDVRPGAAGPVVLPYSMQLGSGTYDITPMASWSGYEDRWSWGGSLQHTWRLGGPNDRRYELGTYRAASLWAGRELTKSLIGNFGIRWSRQADIHGQDPALNPALSPSEHPNQQKAKRLDFTTGLTFYQPKGRLTGLRLGLEIGFPIYQKLRGPQLSTDYFTTLGLRWSF
ncbi:MAG: hypothetical protein ACI8QZ_002900 [Chlamydiales bacterium]